MSEPHQPPQEREPASAPRHTLDPDRAVIDAGGVPDAPPPPPPELDTRRYRWMIGIFGLVLVAAFSVYEFTKHGIVSPGVAGGKQLHPFVAPLATIGPDRPVNTRPHCDPAHPNPLALNVCGRTPLVLAFFVTGSGTCMRQVDTLQAVSRQFGGSGVQFAAVAISAGRAETRRLVRSHRWTIPVAFDSTGAIGALYGVDICPMVELVKTGGTVQRRLIGSSWLRPSALSAQVRLLLAR